jgi:hypothetical protein
MPENIHNNKPKGEGFGVSSLTSERAMDPRPIPWRKFSDGTDPMALGNIFSFSTMNRRVFTPSACGKHGDPGTVARERKKVAEAAEH